jgi:hypothetical protein
MDTKHIAPFFRLISSGSYLQNVSRIGAISRCHLRFQPQAMPFHSNHLMPRAPCPVPPAPSTQYLFYPHQSHIPHPTHSMLPQLAENPPRAPRGWHVPPLWARISNPININFATTNLHPYQLSTSSQSFTPVTLHSSNGEGWPWTP